ncbi:MAG: SAVED domain-containing protein [Candidatus ainarchaeum sp.]|nr:SAVED domain-containing protein [Candidatus ainarchaeum sp.]
MIPDTIYNKIIKRIRVDDSWIKKNLVEHGVSTASKVKIRIYSIAFSGNQEEYLGFIGTILGKISDYVFSQKEIKKIKKEGGSPDINAASFFGDIDPQKDGKYGEFILFLFVEAVLKCPMIAHKIQTYNPNDQVKGSDGLFFGKYDGQQALLIGEAKMGLDNSTYINNALTSLDRFYISHGGGSTLDHELLVTRSNISTDFSKDELDYLYEVLSPGSQEYKNNVKVHPILIIYNDTNLNRIETESKNKAEAEQKVKGIMPGLFEELTKKVKTKIAENHTELSKVYLDFFFIPTSDVTRLRGEFYRKLHGAAYKEGKTD